MILSLSHINLLVPPSTLHLAHAFYSETLGLTPRAVPPHRQHELAWFDIADSGQQVHIALARDEAVETASARHPCFRVGSAEELLALRERIWRHFERGGEGAPREADRPGGETSGTFFKHFGRVGWGLKLGSWLV